MNGTKAKGWSNTKTTEVVLQLLRTGLGLPASGSWNDFKGFTVVDVGSGRGHLPYVLGHELEAAGLVPAEHVFACDLIPASFQYEKITCHQTSDDGRLPFPDAHFDAVVSVEVIEHVENQFAFLRELVRVAKPGAPIIVTTPNTHNLNSRVRNLTWGFALLYDPLPHGVHDPRLLGGHIHPIAPYFLAYTALRSGLSEISFHADRKKTSAFLLFLVLWPLLLLGRLKNAARLKHKKPDIAAENAAWMRQCNSLDMLLSRTTVIAAKRPS